MPRIDRILTLDHPGPLRRFTWPTDPADLPNFRRYNLIYGLNGSGKTSISRVLRGVETGLMPGDCSVEIQVDGRRQSSDQSLVDTIPVRVFNAEFVTSSVISAGQDGVPPIFVFGEHSANLQSEVNRLQDTLSGLKTKRATTQHKQESADSELDSLCRREARGIKQMLSSAGSNPYNNYNKSHYRRIAERLCSSASPERQGLTDEERRSLMAQCLSVPKPTIEFLIDELPKLSDLVDTVSQLLRTSVVSKVIRELESDPSVASWVFAGLELHTAQDADLCLFCGQELPQGRVEQLEAHFSTAYRELIDTIDRLEERLRSEVARIDSVALPPREAFYDSIADAAEAAMDSCRVELGRCRKTVQTLLSVLGAKKDRMFESYGVEVNPETGLHPSIVVVDDLITRHNDTSADFDRATREARKQLEEDSVSETLASYRQLTRKSSAAVDFLQEIESEVSGLTKQIQVKEQSILEHRRPAAELNQELDLYLGHSEVQFAVKDTGYELSRNGGSAEFLSEGEKTAISLLYFLKSLESRDFDLSDGVVVLDDPVSSLDANALYAACGFVRDRTRSAGQLFVFTHNFAFFREMRRWMSSQTLSDDSSFYMLETTFHDGERCSRLRELDPLLRDYESDYHYVFSRIYWHVHSGDGSALEENYAMPNMARQLLERFFAFCRPQKPGSGTLENQLDAAGVPTHVKSRIARFTHAHSHADAIDEVEHSSHVLGETRAVLAEILNVMEQEAPSHYALMERLARRSRS